MEEAYRLHPDKQPTKNIRSNIGEKDDEEEDMKIRGGGMLNAFEDPQSAKWVIK